MCLLCNILQDFIIISPRQMSEIVAETSKDVYPTAENLRKKIRKSCLFLSIGVLLSCSAYVGE